MNSKNYLSSFAVLCALHLCALSTNLFAQSINAEITGSGIEYVRSNAEEAGIIRRRSVETENRTVNPSANQIYELEKLTFSLINQKRAENGLPAVLWSDEVAKVARLHSENMVRFKFFGHKGMDGKNVDARADSFGLTRWTRIGENIAYNRGYRNPVETAVEKWMLSASHRENLLDERWTETAVGIAVTDEGTYYFTQVFLKRK